MNENDKIVDTIKAEISLFLYRNRNAVALMTNDEKRILIDAYREGITLGARLSKEQMEAVAA